MRYTPACLIRQQVGATARFSGGRYCGTRGSRDVARSLRHQPSCVWALPLCTRVLILLTSTLTASSLKNKPSIPFV